MSWVDLHTILGVIKNIVSLTGIVIIISGVIIAFSRYIYYLASQEVIKKGALINDIRLHLGRSLILGLEFIVAADLIGTTTTPDYYDVGLLAIIVAIRTLLSFSINRELMSIGKEK